MPLRGVAVLGAFDRFNYGDLLFPVVLQQMSEAHDRTISMQFYGLIHGDGRSYGSVKCDSIRDLHRSGSRLPDGSAMVIAGGEVLAGTWTSMASILVPKALSLPVRVLRRVWSQELADGLWRAVFGSKNVWPWIVDPCSFDCDIAVAYNTVGGTGLSSRPDHDLEAIRNILKRSAYVSVRDETTRRSLVGNDDFLAEFVELAPDSAIMMSRLFPVARLGTLIGDETRQLLENLPDGYLCFQIGRAFAHGYEAVIAEALDRLSTQVGLPLVLLPLGRARMHEDHIALRRIRKHLRTRAVIPNLSLGIYDLTMLIARSAIFLGTSLHGAIISMSYAVPHALILTPRRSSVKVQAFLDTWDIEEQRMGLDLTQLGAGVQTRLAIPKERLVRNSARLMGLYNSCFGNLLRAIGVDKDDTRPGRSSAAGLSAHGQAAEGQHRARQRH